MKTIAHLTDIHLDEDFPREHGVNSSENWKLILQDVAARRITNIVFGGDIGSPESNAWFFKSVKEYNFHLQLSLGNHDRFAQVRQHYKPAQSFARNEWYYSEEDAYFRTLFLDSSADRISDQQLQWLQEQINTDKKLIVFVHHPVLPVLTAADRKYPLEGREAIQKLLHQHHQQVILFCGHYHMADEQTTGNIIQYITPASSFQMERNPEEIIINAQTFGYRIIHISEDTIETELVSLEN